MSFHQSSKALEGQKRSSSVTIALVSLTEGKVRHKKSIACRRMLNTHLPIGTNPQTDVDMNRLFFSDGKCR